MKTIEKLPLRARLILTMMMRQPTLKIEDFEVVVPLYKKIALSAEERAAHKIEEPAPGVFQWPNEAGDACQKTVELENAEAKKLLAMLNAHSGYSIEDADWVLSLKAALSQ
jgi:hypothetical protein